MPIEWAVGEGAMLKIYLGDFEEAIYNTDVYFNNSYLECWFEDAMVRNIISSIERPKTITRLTELSRSSKTLILIYKDIDHVFNASMCNDNCAPWLIKISENLDRTINLNHIMDFGDSFEVYIINEDRIVNNMRDFVLVAAKYV